MSIFLLFSYNLQSKLQQLINAHWYPNRIWRFYAKLNGQGKASWLLIFLQFSSSAIPYTSEKKRNNCKEGKTFKKQAFGLYINVRRILRIGNLKCAPFRHSAGSVSVFSGLLLSAFVILTTSTRFKFP